MSEIIDLDGVELSYNDDDLEAVSTPAKLGAGTYLLAVMGVRAKVSERTGHMMLAVGVRPLDGEGELRGPGGTIYVTIPARTPAQVLQNHKLDLDLQTELPKDWHARQARFFVNAVAPGTLSSWPLYDRTTRTWTIDGDPTDDMEEVGARKKEVIRQVNEFLWGAFKDGTFLNGAQLYATVSYNEKSPDFPQFDRFSSEAPDDREVVDFS